MPTLSLYPRPSNFGLSSWHLQEKVVTSPVLMLPCREPVHLHHFLDISNSRGYQHMGQHAQDFAIQTCQAETCL